MKRIALFGLLVSLVSLQPTTAYAQDMPNVAELVSFVRWGGVLVTIPIVLGAMVVLRLAENLGVRLTSRFVNRRPTIQLLQTTLRFLVYFVAAALCIVFSVRLDSTALTVLGGALAFAVGFAVRDLVAAFVGGITIMFDRPFQVGDRVTIGEQHGDVLQIGLRSVRIRTLDHCIVTIPNNRIFTDMTTANTFGAIEMQVTMDFYVAPDQDLALATSLVHETCLTSPYVYLGNPVPVYVKQVVLQGVVAQRVRARPYVFDCKYDQDFETDVALRVAEAFRERGIEVPVLVHRERPRPSADG